MGVDMKKADMSATLRIRAIDLRIHHSANTLMIMFSFSGCDFTTLLRSAFYRRHGRCFADEAFK